MSILISKTVNFGSRKGGLSTVGYTLYDSGNNIVQARTTSGVSELITDKGIYVVNISVNDQFIGRIVWDTGEATPLYAVEDIDYKTFAGGGGVIFTGSSKDKGIWTKEEKDKALRDIKNLLTALKKIKIVDNSDILRVIEAKIKESNDRSIVNYKFITDSLNIIRAETKKGDAIKTLQEGIEMLSRGLVAIIENKEVESVIREVNEYVESQNT